jgi:hypothetical protein
MTHLVAVPSGDLHDLPPRWDGLSVVWRGWDEFDMRSCPPRGCDSCGHFGALVNLGLVGDEPQMSHEDVEHDDRAVRLAFSMRSRRERKSWLRLTAFRCTGCGLDVVVDDERNVWDLDESDYGEAGSEAHS